MGNFMGLCMSLGSEKRLQVMKMKDGKILEFRAPMRVRDLLIKYPNSYVGMFKEATQPLPLDYKLKFGKIYYLLPSLGEKVKRIKVIIKRRQLEQLLSNKITLEEVLMEVRKRPCKLFMACNLQRLEAIPEEVEGVLCS